ncbi:MAG: response regulator [Deltaproteobacteria bacterium]|nr:response regulator [Deltaproteobacteria bacterium]
MEEIKRPVILIIDDDEVIRDSCTKVLLKEGYQVETAVDGPSGCKIASKIHPDLALVDLKMPGICGPEILEELSKIDPYMAKVVITGYATVSTAVESMQHGASYFLTKPFVPDELRMVTQEALEKRKDRLKAEFLRKGSRPMDPALTAIFLKEIEDPLEEIENFFSELEDRGIIQGELVGPFLKARTHIQDLKQTVKKWLA